MMRTSTPTWRRMRSRKSPPLDDSRTALVAVAMIFSHCRCCAACWKRDITATARSIASRGMMRSGNDARPSPIISFIRHSVVIPPSTSASATIMWMLLEPTSMAAMRIDWRGAAARGGDRRRGRVALPGMRPSASLRPNCSGQVKTVLRSNKKMRFASAIRQELRANLPQERLLARPHESAFGVSSGDPPGRVVLLVKCHLRGGFNQGEKGNAVNDRVGGGVVERLDRPQPVKLARLQGGLLAKLAQRRLHGRFVRFNRAADRLPRPG